MSPDTALSTWSLVIMAVVVVVSLAIWLIAVFLAAREPRDRSAAVNAGQREEETAVTMTQFSSEARPADKTAALSGTVTAGVHVPYPHGGPANRYANSQVTGGSTSKDQLRDHLEV